jgi:hypothetical protein
MRGEALKSKASAQLRAEMEEAYRNVQQAHARYREALAVIADTAEIGFYPDGALAFQQAGREYAGAVRSYSDAAMAWLSHVETNREQVVKLLRKPRWRGHDAHGGIVT